MRIRELLIPGDDRIEMLNNGSVLRVGLRRRGCL